MEELQLMSDRMQKLKNTPESRYILQWYCPWLTSKVYRKSPSKQKVVSPTGETIHHMFLWRTVHIQLQGQIDRWEIAFPTFFHFLNILKLMTALAYMVSVLEPENYVFLLNLYKSFLNSYMYASYPNIWEADSGELLIWGHSMLHSKLLSFKAKTMKNSSIRWP